MFIHKTARRSDIIRKERAVGNRILIERALIETLDEQTWKGCSVLLVSYLCEQPASLHMRYPSVALLTLHSFCSLSLTALSSAATTLTSRFRCLRTSARSLPTSRSSWLSTRLTRSPLRKLMNASALCCPTTRPMACLSSA